MLSKSIAYEALNLCQELISDLELSRLPLANCFMKGCRLARLLNDGQHLEIFQYELSGYPTSPEGIDPTIFELCRKANRISKSKDKEGNTKEYAFTTSVEQLTTDIDVAKTRLEFGRPQPVNISSANPHQHVHAPMRNIPVETDLAKNIQKFTGYLSSRRSFLYSYSLDRLFELQLSSAAESIFDQYRSRIDNLMTKHIKDELRRLESISKNIASENPEDWANAVHTCRRLLQALANQVYPPSEVAVVRNGKTIKVNADNYINRLIIFSEDRMSSDVGKSIVGSELRLLGDRMDAVFNAVQKGSHAEVTLEESQRYIIHTYLILGDVLELAETSQTEKDLSSSISEGESI